MSHSVSRTLIGADVPSVNFIVCIHSSQEETHFSFKDSSVLFNNECEVTSLPLPQLTKHLNLRPHDSWGAWVTLGRITSSTIRLGIFFINRIKAFANLCRNGGTKTESALIDLRDICLHLPFVLMVRNAFLGWRLYKLGFGRKDFNVKGSAEVEAILAEVGLAGQYEAFCESGPQSITQCVIILCTGRVTWSQVFSITVSLASLTWMLHKISALLCFPFLARSFQNRANRAQVTPPKNLGNQ